MIDGPANGVGLPSAGVLGEGAQHAGGLRGGQIGLDMGIRGTVNGQVAAKAGHTGEEFGEQYAALTWSRWGVGEKQLGRRVQVQQRP